MRNGIIVLGDGYLGNFISNYLGYELCRKKIVRELDVIELIKEYNPKVIINCIGKTGRPNIDWCESHKEETFYSNVMIPLWLGKHTSDKLKLVHVGSGCIYQGMVHGGYKETDVPNYNGSFYSQSKIMSESLLSAYDNVLQLRIRMPIDYDISNPRNFIYKIMRYEYVINEPNSMTIIEDLMEVIKKLIELDMKGIYNVVNPGLATHCGILGMYKEIVDPSFTWKEISTDKLVTVAGRSNCYLNTDKLDSIIKLPNINSRIRDIFTKMKK